MTVLAKPALVAGSIQSFGVKKQKLEEGMLNRKLSNTIEK